MAAEAGGRLQVFRNDSNDPCVRGLEEFLILVGKKGRSCRVGLIHTGQLIVIGNGMKQARNTRAAAIASAILPLPSGSSTQVGGWPTLSKNPSTTVQRIQMGELYRTTDRIARTATSTNTTLETILWSRGPT